MKLKWIFHHFGKGEIALWAVSVFVITVAFLLFDGQNILSLSASILGVTALIFCAKGNPMGQLLMVVFSALYGVISYGFSYYGEMITYLGMTAPMSIFALISWLKTPYQGNRAQVKVNRLSPRELVFMLPLTGAVTWGFYYILAAFHTANLLPSTLSVTTSFAAVYLTFRRSPYYAIAYAANDLILILLWTLAAFSSLRYLPVAVCFSAFFVNDLYGFISWRNMRKRQEKGK